MPEWALLWIHLVAKWGATCFLVVGFCGYFHSAGLDNAVRNRSHKMDVSSMCSFTCSCLIPNSVANLFGLQMETSDKLRIVFLVLFAMVAAYASCCGVRTKVMCKIIFCWNRRFGCPGCTWLRQEAPKLPQFVMDPALAVLVKEKLPHIEPQLCHHILEMCRHFVLSGVDEERRHRGFTIVCGMGAKLLETRTVVVDGESLRVGVFGKSNSGDNNLFQGERISIAKWREHRHIIAPVLKKGGSLVVDCETGSFISMNYFVSDISRGDDGGGAGHKSASAIACNQDAGRCFVVKASETGPTKGSGNLIVFPGQRKPVTFLIHN